MASSIFVYNLLPSAPQIATVVYETLNSIPDDETSYFNMQLLSDSELSGEYVTVQTVEETFYNAAQRSFEQRQAQRASVVYFNIYNNRLEVWGNKTSANRLVFTISTAFQNRISINAIEVSIEGIISKLQDYKVKVSKVCFEDFLFTEDIVGNFTVDLSSYGDAFSVLNKYKEKISRMTIILSCNGMALKISISSKGTIMVYKSRDSFDEDALDTLHAILLK